MFNNLKIATRLKATLGSLAAMLAGVAALAIWQMGVMRASTQEITAKWLPSVELINQMKANIADYRIGEISHVLATNDKEMVANAKEMAAEGPSSTRTTTPTSS